MKSCRDWTPNPTIIDPKTVDWKGVVDGKVDDVMIRQKPGPKNFMGRMKFMFPNEFGVYLHDNPRRELFLKSARYFSGGCVRLEDAARLGRWLFGRDLDWQIAGTEQAVPLAQPVPVYITYLTAMPDGPSVAYYDDVYGRDTAQARRAAAGQSPREALAPAPVREVSDVLRDRPAVGVSGGIEANVTKRQLAHQSCRSRIAARARDAAVRDVPFRLTRMTDRRRSRSECRSRRSGRYSLSGIFADQASRVNRE